MTSAKPVLTFLAALAVATPALAVDWAGISGKEVVLLYPGQSSYEWTLTPADHSGGTKVRTGKNCKDCHTGEEKTMGDLLVSGKKNEPAPIAGKPGSVPATVKFAYDDKNIYANIEFTEGTQPDAKMDAKYATKVTMMLVDPNGQEGVRFGCWATCHDDVSKMPSGAESERTKYLGKTRAKLTRQGGGDELAAAEALTKLRGEGYPFEYWQARLNPGAKAEADGGIVFDKREEQKAAPVTADATFANGKWSVTLSRPLAAAGPFKEIAAGKTYTIGFAIHGGHTAKRFHYVSFERSLTLGQGTADFVAVKK